MPIPERPLPPKFLPVARTLAELIARERRRRGKDLDDGGVPVEPNRPNTLSGGAAAALEFDE